MIFVMSQAFATALHARATTCDVWPEAVGDSPGAGKRECRELNAALRDCRTSRGEHFFLYLLVRLHSIPIPVNRSRR